MGIKNGSDTLKSLKWVPKGKATKIGLGFGTSPVWSEALLSPLDPAPSGPCSPEMGEGLSQGMEGSAQTQAVESEALARCAEALVVADVPELDGDNSGDPTSTTGEADGLLGAGAPSGELAATSDEAVGSSAADLSSGEVVGSAGGISDVGICSDELWASQDDLEELFSTEISSGELERVCARPEGEGAFNDFKMGNSSTGIMPLGAKGRYEGVLVDTVPVQPRLVETPLMALCAASGVSNCLEEDFKLSNPGLGEEESSPIPLMSIIPFGLSLPAENSGSEAAGYESVLDTSKWVKNRLPSFSKLVGLSLNRHEKLCIEIGRASCRERV